MMSFKLEGFFLNHIFIYSTDGFYTSTRLSSGLSPSETPKNRAWRMLISWSSERNPNPKDMQISKKYRIEAHIFRWTKLKWLLISGARIKNILIF